MAPRRPVILEGPIDPRWFGSRRWDWGYLKRLSIPLLPPAVAVADSSKGTAGEAVVEVERAPDTREGDRDAKATTATKGAAKEGDDGDGDDVQRFGLVAPKTTMPFGDFVQAVEDGDDCFYLTTQHIDIDQKDGLHLSLWGPPLHLLRSDFPLRPSLVPTLAPFQMNLWIGNSVQGLSRKTQPDLLLLC